MQTSHVIAACAVLMQASTAIAATLHVPADHKTIQAAIDAAQPGDTVLVASGRYQERIVLKPRITLRSVGDDTKGKLGLKRAEATVIDGGGENGKGPGVTLAAGAALDGFTVTNVGKYDDASWQHHHKTQGNEQKHEHIGHFGTPGIGVEGVNCVVRNNIVHHNGGTGIAIRGVQGKDTSPLVTRNVTYRNMGGGIGSMNGSSATITHNVCFQNFYAGIGHDNASPRVEHNDCYENIRAGIGVSEGACPIVRYNRCHHNRRAGIGSRTGANTQPVIAHNDCFENDMAGIGSDEGAAPIIRNNKCYRNKMAGIGSQYGASPIIIGNEVYDNAMSGIGCRDKAKPLIADNHVHHNKTAGIGVRSGASALIRGNTVIDNKLVAIGVPDGASAVIIGNKLSRKGGGAPPLVALRGGANVVMRDNTLSGGGVAAVLVQGRVRLSDNHFRGRGEGQGSAVWVWADSDVQVTDNTFDGYRHAINASKSAVHASDNRVARFGNAAIIVKQPTKPAVVVNNTAATDDKTVKAFVVEGEANTVQNNKVTPTTN